MYRTAQVCETSTSAYLGTHQQSAHNLLANTVQVAGVSFKENKQRKIFQTNCGALLTSRRCGRMAWLLMIAFRVACALPLIEVVAVTVRSSGAEDLGEDL
jgi:hypothetical protein